MRLDGENRRFLKQLATLGKLLGGSLLEEFHHGSSKDPSPTAISCILFLIVT